MNKLLFIALLIVSSTILTQEGTDKGVFEFENETINYGVIAKNADGNRSFVFTNVGDEPIVITKVKGSCGCTVATKPSDPILPGETAEIGVKYETSRLGGFSKTITITSNASEMSKVIRIKGNVVEEGKIAAMIK